MKQQIKQKPHKEMLRITPNHRKKHPRYFIGNEYPGIYLTEREFQVATLISNKKYREIAELYQLSERTVEYYVTTIKYKLACSSKTELIKKLHLLGISN